MNIRRWTWTALCVAGSALAGQDCRVETVSPPVQAAAGDQALAIKTALDEDGAALALLARVGTDLSAHGLHYSHVGIALRDPRDGRWSVFHLLNECGSDRSQLYAEGLYDFFIDASVSFDVGIVWLEPALAERIAALIHSTDAARLHDPDYNVIAHPRSRRYQNSTAWVLEVLALALHDSPLAERGLAQRFAARSGHMPQYLRIPYHQRVLGGLFSNNAHFSDHPLSARLAGDYEVVTVASIFAWLARNDAIRRREDWRRERPVAAR